MTDKQYEDLRILLKDKYEIKEEVINRYTTFEDLGKNKFIHFKFQYGFPN
jgi:hypothetical protein